MPALIGGRGVIIGKFRLLPVHVPIQAVLFARYRHPVGPRKWRFRSLASVAAKNGLVSLFESEEFLNYNALSTNPVSGQHLGILLVEAGVGITVFATVLLIFYALCGRGVVRHE